MRKQTGCVSLRGCAVNPCLLMVGVIGAGVGLYHQQLLLCIPTPTETPLPSSLLSKTSLITKLITLGNSDFSASQ